MNEKHENTQDYAEKSQGIKAGGVAAAAVAAPTNVSAAEACEATFEDAATPFSSADAVGAGMIASDYHHAKEDLAAAKEAYAAARKQVVAMIVVGILGAWASVLFADNGVTAATLAMGVVMGWGLSGVFGFMRGKGYFLVLNRFLVFIILFLTLFVAMFVGVPLFLYDLYQVKKTKDGQDSAQAALDAITARAASMGVSI